MSDEEERDRLLEQLAEMPVRTVEDLVTTFAAWAKSFEVQQFQAFLMSLAPAQQAAFMKMVEFVVDEEERVKTRTMRDLISTARLDHQHRCDLCNAPLEAYSRSNESRPPAGAPAWRCEPCGGTISLANPA